MSALVADSLPLPSIGPSTKLNVRSLRGTSALSLLVLALAGCGGGGSGGGTPAAETPVSLAAALPEGNAITFADASLRLEEATRYHEIEVRRFGEASTATSVDYRIIGLGAEPGVDVAAGNGRLEWATGDLSSRYIGLRVLSDVETELDEQFSVVLENLDGEERVAGTGRLDVTLVDSACSARLSGRLSSDTILTQPCYVLESSLEVVGNATLALMPGTTILAHAGVSITVSEEASIAGSGTATQPVVLAGVESGSGVWNGVRLISTSDTHVLQHVEILDASIGVDIGGDSKLLRFEANRFADIDGPAVRLPLAVAAYLDGNTRFESTAQGVAITDGRVEQTSPVNLRALDTHYLVTGSLIVSGPLAIEAGAELRFALDTQVYVSARGSFEAIGTEEAPVVLRGEQAEAGHWRGVHYVQSTSAANRLSHVVIRHGGRDPARNANLGVEGDGTSLIATDVTLEQSAGYGLRIHGMSNRVTFESVDFADNRLVDEYRF